MRRNVITISKEAQRPPREGRLPYLFGRGGRDRVLMCLAANGPMHVRAIARAIGSDCHKVFDMVERLGDAGLVIKRDVPGRRKVVALNKQLGWTYVLLRELLLALNARWPVAPASEHIQPREMWEGEDGILTPDRLDRIFQSPVRSRTLFFIAAMGVTDMTTLFETLGLGSVSALYAVNHWEREGVVTSRYSGRHRLVRLNISFPVFTELDRFLMAIVKNSDEYCDLAEAARPRIERILLR